MKTLTTTALLLMAFIAHTNSTHAQAMADDASEARVVAAATIPATESLYEVKLQRIADLSGKLDSAADPSSIKTEIETLQAELLTLRKDMKNIRQARISEAAPANAKLDIFKFDPARRDLAMKDFSYSYEPANGSLVLQFNTKASGQLHVRALSPGSMVIDAAHITEATQGDEVTITLDLSGSALELFFINIEQEGKMVTKKVALS